MKIEHTHERSGGQFTAVDENHRQIGVMSYTLSETDQMSINHTVVNPALEGRGIGHSLVREAVAYAREHHLKIIPVCWFVKLLLNRNADFKDVLA